MKHKELLRRVVEISYKMRLSHVGSCLSALPIIADIYEQKKPDEKVVISNGHAHLAHLVVRANKREMDLVIEQSKTSENIIEKYMEEFGVHCDRRAGCDVSTGSLGHGIGIAVGMALADRSKNVYCLISDGECAEGSVWEALRVASENKLKNLKVYLNANGWGAYRKVDDIYIDFAAGVEIVEADMTMYPDWLSTQEAHYRVLDEKSYKELMEVLR